MAEKVLVVDGDNAQFKQFQGVLASMHLECERMTDCSEIENKVILGDYYAPVQQSRQRNHNHEREAVDLEQEVHALVLCDLYHYRNQTDNDKQKEEVLMSINIKM